MITVTHIIVKGIIDLSATAANENDKDQKNVAIKNNSPFRSWISKINSILIKDAEDLDIVTLIYNLIECSQDYSVTSGSLWNHYKDEIDDVNDNI